MSELMPQELLPDLWMIEDSCNVYLIRDGDAALAIDFGGGEWLGALPSLGIETLEHVLLTHAHNEQCHGLSRHESWPFTIHAPGGEDTFLDPEKAGIFGPPPWFFMGCPLNYCPPPGRIVDVRYNIIGNGHMFWRGRRIRFMDTPGHGRNACSIILDHAGKQLVFCGDAAYEGGTIYQPFHLEWDHWTGEGALAAWEGIERLRGIAIDLLCPSHGPVIAEEPIPMLNTLAERLLAFYHAKGQVSPGEPDRYLPMEALDCGAYRCSEHLYQFGGNGYLLVSETGEALVVDPFVADLGSLAELLDELGHVTPTAMVVSHYHYDHCDGIPALRQRFGAEAWLHPIVAEPIRTPGSMVVPWLRPEPIEPDHLWPEEGAWQWNEYEFAITHWPGQTWWHCGFMTQIDGKKVFFAGDSFTPTSKWNGTGGFCAYNGSRFAEGFVPSARRVIEWQPEVMAAGHSNYYGFSQSKFEKVIEWAGWAAEAVRALCPSGDLERDYHSVHEIVKRCSTMGAEG